MTARPLHALQLPAGEQLRDAVAKALVGGPALAPIDPNLPAPQLARVLRLLRPEVLITADGPAAPPFPAEPVADEVAVIITTSGSTGAPKSVELNATALVASARSTLAYLGADTSHGWLCCLPPHYVAGLQVIVRALVAGAPLELEPRFRPEHLASSTASYVSLVPTMVRAALDAGVELRSWQRILVGGAPLPVELRAAAENAGAHITATYGASETAGGCIYDGIPLPGVGVRLGDDDRIVISGPTLAIGYRRSPTLTASAFTVEGFHTNDIGAWNPDGTLAVLGRIDDVIITGGVKIAAPAVQEVLARHPSVNDVAVFGRADAQWGHRVVAVVVPAATAPGLAELRARIRNVLGAAAAPRELINVPALPLLTNGKLDRQALHRLPIGELWT